MELNVFLWVAFAAFFTSIISSVAGFGGGILIVAAFSFFYDIKVAIAMSSILFLFMNLNKFFFFHKHIDWVFARNVLITALPAALIGLYCFKIIDPLVIKYMLASFAVFMIIDHIAPLRKNKKIKNFTTTKMLIGGSFLGFFAGVGFGAIAKVFLLKLRGLSKEMFVGTGVAITLMLNLVKMPIYFKMDFISGENFIALTPIFFLIFAGTFIGKKILKKISHELFEKLVLVMIGFSAVRFILF